jgi:hypothetical protein
MTTMIEFLAFRLESVNQRLWLDAPGGVDERIVLPPERPQDTQLPSGRRIVVHITSTRDCP